METEHCGYQFCLVSGVFVSLVITSVIVKGKKERKRIYIAPFIYYVYLKALRHVTQFYLQIHQACLTVPFLCC